METHYYWPELAAAMQEILRVLKPGGSLVIIAESCKGGRYAWLQGPVMKLLRSTRLSLEEQRELFATAGYTDVQMFEEARQGWFCGTGQKP